MDMIIAILPTQATQVRDENLLTNKHGTTVIKFIIYERNHLFVKNEGTFGHTTFKNVAALSCISNVNQTT